MAKKRLHNSNTSVSAIRYDREMLIVLVRMLPYVLLGTFLLATLLMGYMVLGVR